LSRDCLPRYFQKRCRQFLWNACTEMDLMLEIVKPLSPRSE
jgi:hypothetical protein